jgi:predicted ATPase/DNA-binding transcriptional ArsR family regulator
LGVVSLRGEEARNQKLALTHREKILLLLSEFSRFEKDYRVPSKISQSGIARAIGIRQCNVARELIKLRQEGFVRESLKHFEGVKRRKKGYFLTDEGLSFALKVRRYVNKGRIAFIDEDGRISNIRVSEAKRQLGRDWSLAEIVANLSEDGVFSVGDLVAGTEEDVGVEDGCISKFVGRKDELKQIQRIYRKVSGGRGECLLISGEAGIGKTRLVNESARRLARKNIHFLQGSCLYQTAVDPYMPFVEALGSYLGKAAKNFAVSTMRDIESTAPEFGGLLPLARTGGGYEVYSGEGAINLNNEKIRIFETINRALVRIAEEKPTVLFIDDLHWADVGSIHLLHYIVRNTQEYPILIIGAYRPEELVTDDGEDHPFWGTISRMEKEKIITQIELERLSVDDVEEMIEDRLRQFAAPKKLINRIYKESEGNPFFIEEILDTIREDGIDDNQNPPAEIEIPDTIKGLVKRRVRNLKRDERKMLEFASAIGEKFDFDLLMQASEEREEPLLDSVEKLSNARLITEDKSDIETYEFHHGKIRDVIYGGLSRRKRQFIHSRIGEAIEELYGDDVEDVTNELAYHYSMTNRFERAYEYCSRAGDKAHKLYAMMDALSHYRNAMDSLDKSKEHFPDKSERSAELLVKMGNDYDIISKWDDALSSYNNALSLIETNDDPDALSDVLWRIGNVLVKKGELDEGENLCEKAISDMEQKSSKNAAKIYDLMGMISMQRSDYERALKRFGESLEIARRIDDKGRAASVHSAMATLYSYINDYDSSLDHHKTALELHKETKNKNSLGVSYVNLGMVYWNTGKYEEAIKYESKALKIMKEIGNQAGIGFAYNILGATYHNKGDYTIALECFEKSLRVREKIGDKHGIAEGYNNVGCIHKNREEYKKAFECFNECLAILSEMGDQRGCAITHFEIGDTHLKKGSFEKGITHFEKSIEICGRIGDKLFSAYDYCGMSECLIGQGSLEKSLSFARKALELSKEIEAKETQIWSLRLFGMIHSERKQWDPAIENFDASIEIGKEINSEVELGKTYYEYAQMWKRRGEKNETKEFLERALRIFDERNLESKAERTKNELIEIEK